MELDKRDKDILIPCKTCRFSSITVGSNFCVNCMKEKLTNAVLNVKAKSAIVKK